VETRNQRFFLALLTALFISSSFGQEDETESTEAERVTTSSVLDQIITPDMERRVIEDDILDNENFEISVFYGVFGIEEFGSNDVAGLRLGYHVTEDFFLETTFGQTTLRETSFEKQSGNLNFFNDRKLTYYNVSIGYNIFPGEIFIGENWAFNTSLYIIAGFGNTDFADESHSTTVFGGGLRLYLTDWLTFHVDVRNHLFDYDLLGEEISTNNLESHIGFGIFF